MVSPRDQTTGGKGESVLTKLQFSQSGENRDELMIQETRREEDYEIAIREEIYCASDRQRKSRERAFKYLLNEPKIRGRRKAKGNND
jgi:hypothetical protein